MIDDEEYRNHMAGVVADGFSLDPPGYERLSPWTHILLHLTHARANFEWVRDHTVELGRLDNSLQQHAFFIAAITAYGRCYASSGLAIPTLNAKKVYQGSDAGMAVHRRLIGLRNTVAAHADQSDLLRVTLAVKDEGDRIVVRHLATGAIPTPEIPDFLDAVAHTEHFVTIALNKQLDYLATQLGKPIALD